MAGVESRYFYGNEERPFVAVNGINLQSVSGYSVSSLTTALVYGSRHRVQHTGIQGYKGIVWRVRHSTSRTKQSGLPSQRPPGRRKLTALAASAYPERVKRQVQ